ncbi:hypothetical protein KIW84_042367 [Lathyrus oleraceus]|uniref:Uncharacterized protein n=1 Tax=Pisum sativum TaxID=3888 RepID=A0A9D5ATA9_PEA|nr:hypothetical protein KIW84_042367 [Pisum sativum]
MQKELSPTQPVDFPIESWWGVCLVNFTLEEFEKLSEEEIATIDKILYPEDRFKVPRLEGFVSNREQSYEDPIENEVVVAEVLRRCGESVKLLDVSSELPQLIRRPGLKKWESIFELIEAFVDKPPPVFVACTRSEAIKALLTTSANGALILRVLQALSSFVTLSTEKENDGISRAHFEFSEINPVLEPLWHELSCCISKIESYSEPAPYE